MAKQWKPTFMARLRAAWALFRAERAVVVTYNPNQPPNILGEIHTGISWTGELPARLLNAALVAAEADRLRDEEGQESALDSARAILKY